MATVKKKKDETPDLFKQEEKTEPITNFEAAIKEAAESTVVPEVFPEEIPLGGGLVAKLVTPTKPKEEKKKATKKIKVEEAKLVETTETVNTALALAAEVEPEPFVFMDDLYLDINEIKAQYFDETALLLQPQTLYRLDGAGLRSYYSYTPAQLLKKKTKTKAAVYTEPYIKFYISVTSLIQATMPTSPHLIAWIAKEGENAELIKEERADYGTLMHIEFENVLKALINGGTYDLDKIPEYVEAYCMDNNIVNCDKVMYVEDLKQDILGFCKFLFDYNVKPLAIEMVLKCDALGTGGALDLVCALDIDVKGFYGETYASGAQKGQPKETKQKKTYKAIVDFKSSRKGVHENHEIQLEIYKASFVENFPQFKDEEIKLFNFRPKNWQKQPDYVLTDQTGKHTYEEIKLLSDIFYLKNDLTKKERTLIGGIIDFNKRSIDKNYRRVNMSNLIINRKQK